MKLGCIESIESVRESNSNCKALLHFYARDINMRHCTACSNTYILFVQPLKFPRSQGLVFLPQFCRKPFVNQLCHPILSNRQLLSVAMEEDNLSQAAMAEKDES